MSELPKGWLQVAFEDVAEINPRKSVDLKPDETVTFVPMAAVNEISGTIVEGVSRPLQEVNRGYTQFANGDVIFAKITPSMENGKSAVAIGLENGIGFGSTEFHVLRSRGAVLPEYLWRFVRQKTFREDAQKVMSGAVGQQRVSADYLKSHQLPLPPISEQRRIVEKVDSLTNLTARARIQLDRVPALLEKQKIAILRSAFEHGAAPDRQPTTRAPNDLASSVEPLWPIPLHWKWLRTDQVGDVDLGRQRSPENHRGPSMRPYIRAANITWSGLDLTDVKEMNFSESEFRRFKLEHGDILLNEGSGSAKEVGKPAIWHNEIRGCCFQNTVLRVRPKICTSEYLYYYYLYTAMAGHFVASTQGVNIQHIGKIGLAAYPVPVPPEAEQSSIISHIESAFSLLDEITANFASAARLVPRLDAAILSEAFRGQLVAQDPNDEPASKLLARIRAEHERAPKPKRVQKVKMRKAPTTMARNLEDVLAEAGDWLPAQEAFRRCGIADGSETEAIEVLYAELRMLDKTGRLEVNRVTDEKGRKRHDQLKLRAT